MKASEIGENVARMVKIMTGMQSPLLEEDVTDETQAWDDLRLNAEAGPSQRAVLSQIKDALQASKYKGYEAQRHGIEEIWG
ncbi:hypothetical protein CC1G_10580 [Coprinopsis cinerea okayama7|uniref:Uncharacterized protein n=1 Tax=Coprinopsis cinerea (strain Okayama-7 / 130 / ATCC MYA-4618 / FGSC 9003) TaxID=240176 RepID=A8NDZ4_COPC7|nr:hypothetical protein CC1G_10580 [Coprinopsis cinerea okayama7\|eukprot:XP_001832904.1 hypothetical protein CC1G_10580 [Coprinopsis cinerea okayama7\